MQPLLMYVDVIAPKLASPSTQATRIAGETARRQRGTCAVLGLACQTPPRKTLVGFNLIIHSVKRCPQLLQRYGEAVTVRSNTKCTGVHESASCPTLPLLLSWYQSFSMW